MRTIDFQKKLVHWFRLNARELPWRETSDPYKIWISEVMLQQTGVSTVIPYYLRFTRRFPTLESLAKGKESEVLHLWQGLGYYRRAKHLLEGARFILEKFQGIFPDNKCDLLKVPGIGEYSSGSILGIAFRKPEAALDGNLIRVYTRYFGIRKDVRLPSTLKELWKIARAHVPQDPSMIREFTEGMMELGALVCRPKLTLCLTCPLQKSCVAKKEDLVQVLPRKSKLKSREKHQELIYILRKGVAIGFLPKGSDPKYPDFYRLPFSPWKKNEAPKNIDHILKYSITHRDIRVYVKKAKVWKKSNLHWMDPKKLQKILLPAIDRKVLSSTS